MERAQAARDGRREETTAASSTFAATLRKCAAGQVSTSSLDIPCLSLEALRAKWEARRAKWGSLLDIQLLFLGLTQPQSHVLISYSDHEYDRPRLIKIHAS